MSGNFRGRLALILTKDFSGSFSDALSTALATFGNTARAANELKDLNTADLFTEVCAA